MANEAHLARLKKGVVAWNQWYETNYDITPNLTEANLAGVHLIGANLAEVILTRAILTMADLTGTKFSGTDLAGANLTRARLTGADLARAHLTRANLTRADLTRAYLIEANLAEANFTGAYFFTAHFSKTNLTGANFSRAYMEWTIFADVDLSTVQGLETVQHKRPSTIGIDTLYRSRGNIPEIFLRGAGVPDEMITYSKSLVGQPFQYYSCFISYSSRDEVLAQRLHADLQDKGVRCWFAPEDLKIGDEFRSRIDESIQVHDRLLLILSEHSVKSRWVQKEVETAFEKEGKENRMVLFPVRTDEAVMQSEVGWAADIRRQRHIGDFRQWKDHDTYQKAFQRLLRDLKANI
jgi:uncharacterized protein YjbI with pentapeptide repeats